MPTPPAALPAGASLLSCQIHQARHSCRMLAVVPMAPPDASSSGRRSGRCGCALISAAAKAPNAHVVPAAPVVNLASALWGAHWAGSGTMMRSEGALPARPGALGAPGSLFSLFLMVIYAAVETPVIGSGRQRSAAATNGGPPILCWSSLEFTGEQLCLLPPTGLQWSSLESNQCRLNEITTNIPLWSTDCQCTLAYSIGPPTSVGDHWVMMDVAAYCSNSLHSSGPGKIAAPLDSAILQRHGLVYSVFQWASTSRKRIEFHELSLNTNVSQRPHNLLQPIIIIDVQNPNEPPKISVDVGQQWDPTDSIEYW
ncbi:hypothetical protein B0H17DRAFT_1137525 [Mycena rosella]|uniref:Uncharacterized protein n=1 Tax=Mycena rosella TaxID=1033263 RepID=A0AAD7D9R9_MYCRO|nr:hypothetical protein B0H17DRAFT_1137525 [Mycena rosella]